MEKSHVGRVGRAEADLRTHLGQLQSRTNLPVQPTPFHDPLRVIDAFPEHATIDIPAFWGDARQQYKRTYFWDLVLAMADGKQLRVELDQAPQTIVMIDLNALPAWAQWL